LELRILAQLLQTRFLKAGNLDQLPKVVRIAGLHLLLVRKLATLSSLRDTGLDRTLNRVASQLICAVEVPQLEQSRRLLQPDLRKLLEILPVHPNPS
jgi:hypothetical protein